MYVRNDPNSKYNISEDKLASSAEEAEIRRRLESLGKVYYHAEDFKNAMKIITDAIEYSLKHEYPWMSYQEAVEAFKAGRIKYSFGDLPTLFIGFDKQITDPKTLAGIVSGEIKLVDEDEVKPKKKKRKKAEEMEGVYVDIDIIGDAEHKMYVDMHNAGWDTPISLMLKASSTLYNRYVMPPSQHGLLIRNHRSRSKLIGLLLAQVNNIMTCFMTSSIIRQMKLWPHYRMQMVAS